MSFIYIKKRASETCAPLQYYRSALLNAASATGLSASLGRLFVVCVLFQVAKNTALLDLQIEALERTVNTLTILYNNVNQRNRLLLERLLYMIGKPKWNPHDFAGETGVRRCPMISAISLGRTPGIRLACPNV